MCFDHPANLFRPCRISYGGLLLAGEVRNDVLNFDSESVAFVVDGDLDPVPVIKTGSRFINAVCLLRAKFHSRAFHVRPELVFQNRGYKARC